MPIDIAPLMANAGLTADTTTPDKLIKLMTEMHNFQEIMSKFKQAQVDNNEYSFLKCISLFKASKLRKRKYFFFKYNISSLFILFFLFS